VEAARGGSAPASLSSGSGRREESGRWSKHGWCECEVDLPFEEERAHQEAGAGQQEHGKRDFAGNQSVPHSATAKPGVTARAGPERFVQIALADASAGASPKTNAVAMATPTVTRSTSRFIEMTASSGNVYKGMNAISPFSAAEAKKHPAAAPATESRMLSVMSLADDSPASRAQRHPKSQFFLADSRPGQQQVRHISAGNKQQQADGGKQRQQRGSELAHGDVAERIQANDELRGIAPRINRRQPLRKAAQLGFRPLTSSPRLRWP